MNRTAYAGIFAFVFLAFAFLTGCSSNSYSPPAGTNTYVFYLSGQETLQDGPNFNTVAGAVNIDSNGNVVTGEQDYNDGFAVTATDKISAGKAALAIDSSTGQGPSLSPRPTRMLA